MTVLIGTAAWALPRTVRDSFPPGSNNLARYAARFAAVEINSSFHRPHRPATYTRWAASVPAHFRFAVKLPKAISHEARLADCEAVLARFADEIGGLGEKRGPILVQLPPKLGFDAALVSRFLAQLRDVLGCAAVFEPRHPSWFAPEAEALLAEWQVARVAADPAPVPDAAHPGGWPKLAYFRLHGSPRTYWSSYDEAARNSWLARVRAVAAEESWVIFDNTAGGAATADALAFQNRAGPVAREATGPTD